MPLYSQLLVKEMHGAFLSFGLLGTLLPELLVYLTPAFPSQVGSPMTFPESCSQAWVRCNLAA